MKNIVTLIVITTLILMSTEVNATKNQDTTLLAANIKNVTVFFEGAVVNRIIPINLSSGEHILRIDTLPQEINPQSIQLKSTDNCKILSVKHATSLLNNGRKTDAEKLLDEQLKKQELQIKQIRHELNAYDIEEKLLIDNSLLSKENAGTVVSNIKEAADFYRSRINEIRKKKLELIVQSEQIQEEIKKINSQLNTLINNRQKTYSQIFVVVNCKNSQRSELNLSYFVSSAGWAPTYDFRVADIDKPLAITYNAELFQSTGEDWNNVLLTLSTANPTIGGEKPKLKRWYLGSTVPTYKKIGKSLGYGALEGTVFDTETGEPIPFATISCAVDGTLQGTTTDFDGNFSLKPLKSGFYDIEVSFIGYESISMKNVRINENEITTKKIKLLGQEMALEEVVVSGSRKEKNDYYVDGINVRGKANLPKRNVTSITGATAGVMPVDKVKPFATERTQNYVANTLKKNVTNLEYKIDVPYSVPSDGKDYVIRIKEVQTPADYVYHAVPKIGKEVYLTAELANWAALNLLSGKTSIYYQGTFTSEAYLNAEQTEDTLSISLGRDESIVVERKGNKTVYDRRIIGSRFKETIGWDVTIRNNKSTSIRIMVEDQFPLSSRKSVEVSDVIAEKATKDKKTGTLTWDLNIDADSKQLMQLQYTMKYPKNERIVTE